MRLGSAVRGALVRRASPLSQLELVTSNENWVTTQAVRVVATLDIPDLIAAGVTELDDLATRVRVDRDALSRLSRHLVGRGVFVQTTPSSVGLTPLGELLRSGNPSRRHQYFQLTGITPRFESALAQMMYSIRTGEAAYPHVHGEGLWEQLAKDPVLMTSFDVQMTSHAREIGPALVENYDWHDVSRIADVGGGSGELLRIVLDSCRDKTGTILEFADAVQRAKDAMNDAVCAKRCEVVEANFLDQVPSVADAYLLSWILHDWDDEHAMTILRHCGQAAGTHGRVLVIEKPYDLALGSAQEDLRMLVFVGARERTRREYETLATRSGLRVESWTPLVSGFAVMDCRPAD